jgi:hypothetical protein
MPRQKRGQADEHEPKLETHFSDHCERTNLKADDRHPGQDNEAESRVQLPDPSCHEFGPSRRIVPMALRQTVG